MGTVRENLSSKNTFGNEIDFYILVVPKTQKRMKLLSAYTTAVFVSVILAGSLITNFFPLSVCLFVAALGAFALSFYIAMRSIITANELKEQIRINQ